MMMEGVEYNFDNTIMAIGGHPSEAYSGLGLDLQGMGESNPTDSLRASHSESLPALAPVPGDFDLSSSLDLGWDLEMNVFSLPVTDGQEGDS